MHWMSAHRCEGFLCDHETTHWLTGSLHHSCSHVAAHGGWSCSGSPQPLNSNTRVLKTAVVFPCLLMLSRHISHWRQFFYMPSNLFFSYYFSLWVCYSFICDVFKAMYLWCGIEGKSSLPFKSSLLICSRTLKHFSSESATEKVSW